MSNFTNTDDLLSERWDRIYLRNSFGAGATNMPGMYGWQYAAMIISAVVLIHSFFINGTKYRTVRFLTDIAAITTIGQALITVLSLDNHLNERESSYLFNVVGQGVFSLLNQFSDNYAVYIRYVLINSKFPRALRAITFLYVLGLMYATWWPLDTVVPWFVNLNDPSRVNDLKNMGNVWYYSYMVYDCLFTILLLYSLFNLQFRSTVSSSSQGYGLYIIAIKAICHNIFSLGGLYASFNYMYFGYTLQNLSTVFSLHIINWKFEKYFTSKHWNSASSKVNMHRSSGGPATSTTTIKIKLKPLPADRGARDNNNSSSVIRDMNEHSGAEQQPNPSSKEAALNALSKVDD